MSKTPSFNNHQESRYTSLDMATNAGVRVAVGVVCCWGFAFAALLFFYAIAPWTDHRAIAFFRSRPLDTMLFDTAGVICVFVIARLIQGRRWAWWTAFAVSILMLGLGAVLLYFSLHAQTDFEGF
jgi:uncharacterized protein YacL